MSNYPDDIHNYDSNPLSPFHTSTKVQCAQCDGWFPPEDLYTLEGDDEPPFFCDGMCIDKWLKENEDGLDSKEE